MARMSERVQLAITRGLHMSGGVFARRRALWLSCRRGRALRPPALRRCPVGVRWGLDARTPPHTSTQAPAGCWPRRSRDPGTGAGGDCKVACRFQARRRPRPPRRGPPRQAPRGPRGKPQPPLARGRAGIALSENAEKSVIWIGAAMPAQEPG